MGLRYDKLKNLLPRRHRAVQVREVWMLTLQRIKNPDLPSLLSCFRLVIGESRGAVSLHPDSKILILPGIFSIQKRKYKERIQYMSKTKDKIWKEIIKLYQEYEARKLAKRVPLRKLFKL